MKNLSEWQAWGEIDPLYAVATVAGKAKTDDSPWSEGEFFASGLVAWNVFKRRWDAYGRPNSSCLEIGCGAGRLTRALASDFQLNILDPTNPKMKVNSSATYELVPNIRDIDNELGCEETGGEFNRSAQQLA